MRETKIFQYYSFGYDYYILHYEIEDILVRGGSDSLLQKISDFLDNLDELDLNVTKQAASELREISVRLKDEPKDKKVDRNLQSEVEKAIDRIDATLDAELQLRNAYIVTPKRFELNHLLKNPENLFAAKIFAKLPLLQQYDFKEACKCIAFGLPTAAAFHTMRGIEGTLRYYYCSIVKRGRVEPLLWGKIIIHLRKRRDAPPKTVIDHLDNIRDNFRNPTQHPEARYDMDGAQDLLSVSIESANRMMKDIKKRGQE